MTKEAKTLVGLALATLAIFIGGIYFFTKPSTNTSENVEPTLADQGKLVHDDSYKISYDNAKVTIVEFGDFQCPACKAAQPLINKLLEEYKGKVNFVFRNFPLTQHKNARIAAEAAAAAGEQGKFWEMFDLLYENQASWSEASDPLEIYLGYARSLDLDLTKFEEFVKGKKHEVIIDRDLKDGYTLSVNATPTFYINAKKYTGGLEYNSIKAVVEKELASFPETKYSSEDLSKHSDLESCWLAINGKIYDVTNFISDHPGGKAILAGCGKDATAMFNLIPSSKEPHSDSAKAMLGEYEIGILAN